MESQAAGRVTPELAGLITLMVRRYAGKVIPNCDRDDIAQEMIVIFSRHLDQLDATKNLFSYITSAIRNEVLQQHDQQAKFDALRLNFWRSQSRPDHNED